ncbi:MAG TPA: superoxide dismutase family protein [Sphingobacteriaceae bacterium]|nr:superoxide dismutase family protein [Sphingobacteriaceae bacterium]
MILRLQKWWPVLAGGLLALVAAAYLSGGGPGGSADDGAWPQGRLEAAGQFVAGPLAPELSGSISFYRLDEGTLVTVEVQGLPPYRPAAAGMDPIGPYGFHIHEFGVCETGDPDDPFLSAGMHWNPDNQPHGNHPGDFPVIFSEQGRAFMSFVTRRFTPRDVVGLSVIIHEHPDDYRTQPTGSSGRRLACALIEQS